ncbi:MarR family winged helix-turn-helix transcriptional regulator [Methylobacterium sp. P31]
MYRLSNSFPYLIARLGIRTGELFTRVARRDGLSLQMYRVLATLSEEERPLRLGELAARTSADLSTLSRVVAEMHRRGYVRRERSANDQRSVQVYLEEPGRILAARYMPVAKHYEDVSTRSLSPEQRELLRTALIQLYENLDQIQDEIANGVIDQIILKTSPECEEPSSSNTAHRKRGAQPSLIVIRMRSSRLRLRHEGL